MHDIEIEVRAFVFLSMFDQPERHAVKKNYLSLVQGDCEYQKI